MARITANLSPTTQPRHLLIASKCIQRLGSDLMPKIVFFLCLLVLSHNAVANTIITCGPNAGHAFYFPGIIVKAKDVKYLCNFPLGVNKKFDTPAFRGQL